MSVREPVLSVVVPCYRQAHLLPGALRSVLAAENVSLEIIVVDDGSPDDVAAACAEFKAEIRIIRQANAGVGAARNAGWAMARGAFVHFLDADDEVETHGYAKLLRALRAHTQWSAAAGHTRYLKADGVPTECLQLAPAPGELFQALARSCVVVPASLIYRRTALERAGGYDVHLGVAEDWDLLLRIARTGAVFGSVNCVTYRYRIHPAGCSRRALPMYRACLEVLRRARNPDPRVNQPAAKYAGGADPADLPERCAFMAAACLGKALGAGDLDAAEELLAEWSLHRRGAAPPLEQLQTLYWGAAMNAGLVPPEHLAASRACWPALLGLAGRLTQSGRPLDSLCPVAEALFGTALLEQRVEELEGSLLQRGARKIWRAMRPHFSASP